MILIDTSAWIEFLRDTGSPVCRRVDDLLAGDVAAAPTLTSAISQRQPDAILRR